MGLPIAAIGGAIGSLFGLFGSNKKNKQAAQEFALQQQLANKQIEYGDYVNSLSRLLQEQQAGFEDSYGGGAVYDPVTKKYKTQLGAVPAMLQGASDSEEFARNTTDQELRRNALIDVASRREGAATDANTARADLADFRQGIGAVDGAAAGSQMRLDRTRAVNAGYDDAAKQASILGLRTGSSSVGSALEELARRRTNAQAQIGSPELEGVQYAQGINDSRLGNKMNLYNMFTSQANEVPNINFNPAPYAAEAAARTQDAQKIDLSKFEIGMGGTGAAAATVGNAASGIRQGYQQKEANTEYNPIGKFVSGISGLFGK